MSLALATLSPGGLAMVTLAFSLAHAFGGGRLKVLDKETCSLMKQFSLLEIISTAAVLLAVVVESSRVFHVVG